jgi:S1-C subfamily serine protease
VPLGACGIANLDRLLSREKLRAPGGMMGNRQTPGVQFDELTVSEVMDEGVGQKAGLTVGDVIVKIGGTKVGERFEMMPALREGAAKTTVTVLRNGKELELQVAFEPAASAK